MTAERRSLVDYEPGMSAIDVQAAIGVSEHGRRELERSGVLVPIKIGRRKVYPRHQVFTILGLVDPDIAAADAARQAHTQEAPSVDDAPSNLVALDPPRSEMAT